MIRTRVIYFIFVYFFLSCSQGQPYTYIEVVKSVTEQGDSVIKYRAGENIFQDSDSAAYIEAYRRFITSASANAYLNRTKGTVPFRPFDFKLRNAKGTDISKAIRFVGKSDLEAKLRRDIEEMAAP
ncbi:MAG: hypothetical protein EOP06_05045 [Proteobacteria bacterium]|nr:MAG: hypothetical protein EOP06_05045 [Pseudomonadota bacterium]